MVMIRSVRGMNDLFETDLLLIRKLEKTINQIFCLYGFDEIRTPIVEELSLFKRGVGEMSDIVEKEMFVIKDNEHEYCLRPENTASVVRALIQRGGIDESFSEKLFYMGAMFRKERPQKGRLRQFHQYGVESFGHSSYLAEVEILSMIDHLFKELKVNNVELLINSLGNEQEKIAYKALLYDFLILRKEELCEDCKRRIEKNTLRILDCKNKTCQEIAKAAPTCLSSLGDESKKHFNSVLEELTKQNIIFTISDKLVRGLDYYQKTVFEFVNNDYLGAQNTIAAGGRYDGLFSTLGNKIDLPAVGLAGGMERLVLLLSDNYQNLHNTVDLAIVTADEYGRREVSSLAFNLRKLNIKTDFCLEEKSLKAQMRRANKVNASFVLVLGQEEIKAQKVTLKNFNEDQKIDVALSHSAIAHSIANKK